MSWLERIRPRPPQAPPAPPEPARPLAFERGSPALAALFERLQPDGSHAILDLGPATTRHLGVLRDYARRIRFLGILPVFADEGVLDEAATLKALTVLPPDEDGYDVVLAWDAFDRLDDEARNALINRLAAVTRPGAFLYTFVDSSDSVGASLQCTLIETNRLSQETVGAAATGRPPMLPAQVERALAPFEVVQAFSLRIGLREYLTQRA